MAEIQQFISPDAQKQVNKYIQDIAKLSTQYNNIAKSAQSVTDKQKTQASTQKDLDEKTKQYNNLLVQLNTTSGKLAVSGSNLNKELIKQKEQLRLTNQQIKAGDNLYKQLNITLEQARTKARNASIAHGLMSTQAKKARKDFLALDAQVKKLDTSLGQGTRYVGQYGMAWGGVNKLLGALGFAGVMFTAVRAIKDGIAGIREFGKQNAILAGILGKTRKEIGVLTNDAKRLGRETAKSADEVTSLQIAYARLGFSQKEILELTEDTIDGSIALNAELDQTAELTGAVVRTFDDLKTTDAGLILDQLTLSTQRSALSFEKLQTAIPIVAGAANTAGIPFTKLLGLLGKLSDSGIDASSSATALRNIFIESAKQGLNYEQILDKIVGSQDKLTAANDEFGKRAAVSATILAKNIKGVNDLDTALQSAGGTAKRVAEEQLNTLDGRITLLTSAYDGFVKSLDKGDTALSMFVNNGIESITRFLNFLSQSDEFEEGLFTKAMTANSQENLKRFKETFEKDVADIESKYTDSQLTMAASTDNLIRRLAFVATASVEEVDAFDDTKKAAADLIQLKTKLRIINDLLIKSTEKSTNTIDKDTTAVKKNRKEWEDLTKIQREYNNLKVEWHAAEEQRKSESLISAEEGALKTFKIGSELTDKEQKKAINAAQTKIDLANLVKQNSINAAWDIATAATNLLGQETAAGKVAAITESAISGYVGAQKAFTETPGPVFVKFAAAAAAASFSIKNIAKIISTKTDQPELTMPAFAEGTGSTPSGNWLMGEAGDELKIDKKGNAMLVSKPTIFNNEVGSTIFSNSDTKKILQGQSPSQQTTFNDSRIVKAIQDNVPMMGINKYGIITIAKKNTATTKVLNSKWRN